MSQKHELDFAPDVVGTEEDWYLRDDNGLIISRDAYGKPIPHDPLWVAARKNANGHQYEVLENGALVGACIGGSAASICAGIFPGHEDGCRENTFNSKLSLYYELREEEALFKAEDVGKEIIFKIGHDYEDGVARTVITEINEHYLNPRGLVGWLVNDTRMFRCGVLDENGNLKYPHAIGDMDRKIVCYPKDIIPFLDDENWMNENPPVETYGLEIKTSRNTPRDAKKWSITSDNPNGAPENYQVQCHHYMAVCNIDGFFLAVQSYSMHPSDMLVRFIPRDITLETRILDAEERFVQNSIAGIKPTAEEDVIEKRLVTEGQFLPEVNEVERTAGFELDEAFASTIFKMASIDSQLANIKKDYEAAAKMLEAERNILSADLISVFQTENKSYGYLKGEFNGEQGMFFIHQNHKKGRAVTDIELLEQNNPVLAAKCVKKSAAATGLTKAEKEELAKYQSIQIKDEIETKINFSSNASFEKKKTRTSKAA